MRCSDEHKVAFREMTDERSYHDSGDDKQSEESSNAEVINGDADDTKDTVAHDTQMTYSPSFLPDRSRVCVETDVNRPKEKGQPVMEGTLLRSAQQTATQATRQASEPELKRAGPQAFETSCTAAASSVVVKPEGEEVAVHEYLSDVRDEVVNDEEHKNQCGLRASVKEPRLSPLPVSSLIQWSRHVQRALRCVR